jgi:hypothetical protein
MASLLSEPPEDSVPTTHLRRELTLAIGGAFAVVAVLGSVVMLEKRTRPEPPPLSGIPLGLVDLPSPAGFGAPIRCSSFRRWPHILDHCEFAAVPNDMAVREFYSREAAQRGWTALDPEEYGPRGAFRENGRAVAVFKRDGPPHFGQPNPRYLYVERLVPGADSATYRVSVTTMITKEAL